MDNLKLKQPPTYEIPKDWNIVKLSEIFTLEYGKGLPANERTKGNYPVFGSNGIVGYHEQFLVKGPGIVVGRKGTIGAVTWVDSDFWPIDTTYFVKTKNENVFLKWLFFKLKQSNLPRLSQSDVVPGLKRELVYHITIPLPPLLEQRRIGEVLGTVDSAIQKVGGAIEKTERLKKGLMQRLLTRGIGHERFKESEVGRVPEEWEVVRLGDKNITNLIMGQSPPSSTYNDKGIGLPFLQGNAEFGESYPTPILSCSQPIKIAEKNDILLSVRAPVGDVNITPSKSCIGRGLAAIRSKSDKLEYLFLCYYLKIGSRKFESLSMGSTFKAIRKEEVENFQFPLPPLPEQHRIIEILSAIDKKRDLESKRKEKLGRIKKGLMNDLLTGRKRLMKEVKI